VSDALRALRAYADHEAGLSDAPVSLDAPASLDAPVSLNAAVSLDAPVSTSTRKPYVPQRRATDRRVVHGGGVVIGLLFSIFCWIVIVGLLYLNAQRRTEVLPALEAEPAAPFEPVRPDAAWIVYNSDVTHWRIHRVTKTEA
jgi:hypothetical protein